MKKAKLLAAIAVVGGTLWQSGCGIWRGTLAEGFIDNRWADLFLDILNEELFG
jgi:hypothetical protein